LGSTFLFKYPTVTALLDYLEQGDFVIPGETTPASSPPTPDRLGDRSTVVPIRPEGSKPPLFLVSGILGSVFDLYPLGKYLESDRPIYGLRSLGTDEGEQPLTRMEEIAAYHIQSILEIRPDGPYYLGGHSFGGKVAFEMARQLRSRGQEVAFLAVMDIQVGVPEPEKDVASWDESRCLANLSKIYGSILGKDLGVEAEALQLLSTQERLDYLHFVLKMAGQPLAQSDLRRMAAIYKANTQASVEYRIPNSDPIPMVLFRAAEAGALGNYLPDEAGTEADRTWGWKGATSVPIQLELIPGNHFTMIAEPHVRVLAERLQLALEQ
jgi:thioesterase domain-containing protein